MSNKQPQLPIANQDEKQEETQDPLQQAAMRQVKKFKTSVTTKKKSAEQDKPVQATSLESLVSTFDNEKFISFVSNDDASEFVTFRVKTMDPGLLLLETSSPVYIKFAQNIAADETYLTRMTDEEQMQLLRSEIEHKYRVLETCVLEPAVSVDGTTGFPISELPAEIVNELYGHIMGTAEEGADVVSAFQEEEPAKDS